MKRMLVKVQQFTFNVGRAFPDVMDIEKSQIQHLPPFNLASKLPIHLAHDLKTAEHLCELLRNDLASGVCTFKDSEGTEFVALGFDTETKPKFIPGEYKHKVSVIQLSSSSNVYLFHVSRLCMDAMIPPDLLSILSDKSILKVGVGCKSDQEALRTRCPQFNANGSFVNLEILLKQKYPSLSRLGLRNSIGSIFGRVLSKKMQMSNWDKNILSGPMIEYAANDAIAGVCLFTVALGGDPQVVLGSFQAQTTYQLVQEPPGVSCEESDFSPLKVTCPECASRPGKRKPKLFTVRQLHFHTQHSHPNKLTIATENKKSVKEKSAKNFYKKKRKAIKV